MLCVPIVGEAGETLAVIQIVSPSKHSFGPDVQYRLAMVAAQSSAAFQNASHFQVGRERGKRGEKPKEEMRKRIKNRKELNRETMRWRQRFSYER